MTLNSKSILITGAKGGLGSFVTEKLLAEGARVTGISRSINQSDFPHPNFTAMPADLATLADAARIVEETLERVGRIEALVHLVGAFAGGPPLPETSDQDLARMFMMNFQSAFHMSRAVLPPMRREGSGRILAIASHAAVAPAAGQSAYAASKAALVSLIRSIAIENTDRGICANVILPGTLDTPANRTAMPDALFRQWTPPTEVAALLAHLASDSAAHLTGAVIPIDASPF
jgi:NAD(P)-dependent dehydrogenase (short-subunit alcohol dehydrogenase family)